VIDTGVREGRAQIAFDAALISLHKAGRSPDTVRFFRFPPTVLIGRHQALSSEVKLDYVRAHNIGLVRRMTGGGAIYLDEGQVAWELVLSRRRLRMDALADFAAAICGAVAAGLSAAFGIAAGFRPRNDIEVAGRKLCGTSGFFDGDTLIYQGTVLVDMDPVRMVACLNVPAAKLAKRDLDRAEQRVVTLKELLGQAPSVDVVHRAVLAGLGTGLGVELQLSSPSSEEEDRARKCHADEIGTDAFVHEIDHPHGAGVIEASHSGPGGMVTAYLRFEGEGAARRVREALITGDFIMGPPRIIYDLEASLRGVRAADAGAEVDRFFKERRPDLITIAAADFRTVIEACVAATSTA
jgi:lipoate-protein ligase A